MIVYFWSIVVSLVIVDQMTKWLAVAYLADTVPVIDSVFHLVLVYNKGAAFGLLQNQQWLFVLTSVAVVAGLVFYQKAIIEEGPLSLWAYALIGGGAIGNLIDRLRIRAVIDFLDFRIWPVFNIADTAICIGMGLLVLCFLFYSKKVQ